MPIPQVHRFDYQLVEEIYLSMGKHTRVNRWKFRGTQSPLLNYGGGHPFLDRLQERSRTELQVSLELLRAGFIMWINEHSTTYLMPLPFDWAQEIEVHYEPAHFHPDSGSVFQVLTQWGIKPESISWLAHPHEYESSMTHIHLILENMTLLFWTNGESFSEVTSYFNKPLCSLLLPVKVFPGN